MKTFRQFSEQAYSSYELVEGPVDYLRSSIKGKLQDVKNIPGGLKTYASQLKQKPLRTVASTGRQVIQPSVIGKSVISQAVKEPIKKVTGNSPIVNKAIDFGADWVAPYTPGWRKAGMSALRQVPRVGRGIVDLTRTAINIGGTIGGALSGLDKYN